MEVFKDAGLDELLDALMDGYHSTVFAYGRPMLNSLFCSCHTGALKVRPAAARLSQWRGCRHSLSESSFGKGLGPVSLTLRFSYQPGTVAKAPQAGSLLNFAGDVWPSSLR